MTRRVLSFVLFAFGCLAQITHGASPFAGFYVGQIYTSISGNISVPDRPIGAVSFTVNENGVISSSGDLSGTVADDGAITFNANSTGFTTGKIENGVVSATTSINNSGTISTFRDRSEKSRPWHR